MPPGDEFGHARATFTFCPGATSTVHSCTPSAMSSQPSERNFATLSTPEYCFIWASRSLTVRLHCCLRHRFVSVLTRCNTFKQFAVFYGLQHAVSMMISS